MSSQEQPTFQKFDRQIGGHDRILSANGGFLIVKPCNSIEKNFYEDSVSHPDFAEWIPKYYGSLQLQGVQSTEDLVTVAQNIREEISSQHANITGVEEAVCIENLMYNFKRPCIMDLKLGTQLWGEDANEAKIQKMIKRAKETTSGSLGIRIVAYQVYQKSSDSFFNFTKADGYKTTSDTVLSDLTKFFTAEISIDHRRLIIERFINDLESYLNVLEKQEIRLIGGSLFFVYEGDPDAFAEALKKEQEQKEQERKEQERKEQERKEKERKEQEKDGETKIYRNGYVEEEIKEEDDEDDEDEEDERDDEVEEDEEDSDSDEDPFKVTNLKMIDFAHSFFRKGIGKDEGVLLGAKNTINYFKQILNEKKYR